MFPKLLAIKISLFLAVSAAASNKNLEDGSYKLVQQECSIAQASGVITPRSGELKPCKKAVSCPGSLTVETKDKVEIDLVRGVGLDNNYKWYTIDQLTSRFDYKSDINTRDIHNHSNLNLKVEQTHDIRDLKHEQRHSDGSMVELLIGCQSKFWNKGIACSLRYETGDVPSWFEKYVTLEQEGRDIIYTENAKEMTRSDLFGYKVVSSQSNVKCHYRRE